MAPLQKTVAQRTTKKVPKKKTVIGKLNRSQSKPSPPLAQPYLRLEA
jgi:hypothetical protein